MPSAVKPDRDPYGPDPDSPPDPNSPPDPGSKPEAPVSRAKLREALERLGDPKTASGLIEAAEILRKLDDYDAALGRCLEALRLAPRSSRALLIKAELYFGLGLSKEAGASIAALERLKPGARTLLEAARLQERMAEHSGALRSYRLASEADASLSPARQSLARMLLWHGRYSEAKEQAAAEPRLSGAAEVCLGRPAEALPRLEEAVARDPGDAEALVWRAEALRALGRPEPALRDLAAARELEPRSMAALLVEAAIRISRGQRLAQADEDAIMSFLPHFLRRPPGKRDPAWLPRLEKALRLMRGNRSARVTYFRKGKVVEHLHYHPRSSLVQIQSRLRFGDWKRVLGEFDALVKAEPREAYLRSHRGEIHLWLGRYEDARRDLLRARRLDGRLLWPRVGLCALEVLGERPERARDSMRELVSRDAAYTVVLPWAAELYRRLGMHQELLSLLRDFDEPPPFRPHVWMNLALSMGSAGDRKGQREIFDRLLRGVPEFLGDAAREAGLAASSPLEPRQIDRVLLSGIRCLRGNRSRWFCSYFTGGGELKYIRYSGVDPAAVPEQLRGYPWMFSEPFVP